MPKSSYLSRALANHWLGGPDYARPATVWIGLYIVAPTAAGGGTPVTGSGYARVAVTNNDTNWPDYGSGPKSNGTAVTFATATGTWSSGSDIVAFGIFDHATAGNLLAFGDLDTAKPCLEGDTMSFAVGELDYSES
jgi:hypothetical protein